MDRRSFMAGSAAVAGTACLVAVPVAAVTQGRAEWYVTLARWKAAEAEANAYAAANFTDDSDGDCDEMDRLDAIEDGLSKSLMDSPAPDRAALRWKLDRILRDEGSGGISAWNNSYIEQTRRDIARLLGDA